jgi:hypothetical protein
MPDYVRLLVKREVPIEAGDDELPVYTRFERKSNLLSTCNGNGSGRRGTILWN